METDTWMIVVGIALGVLVSAVIGGLIGDRRGCGVAGAWLGAFFGPIGWLIALFTEDLRPRCLHCRSLVDDAAVVCWACGADVTADIAQWQNYRILRLARRQAALPRLAVPEPSKAMRPSKAPTRKWVEPGDQGAETSRTVGEYSAPPAPAPAPTNEPAHTPGEPLYFYCVGADVKGPVTLTSIVLGINSGTLPADAQVMAEGTDKWIPVAKLRAAS